MIHYLFCIQIMLRICYSLHVMLYVVYDHEDSNYYSNLSYENKPDTDIIYHLLILYF